MGHLTAYLLAQGKRQPLQTLRFCAAEAVRRTRLLRPAATNGSGIAASDYADRLRPFIPAGWQAAQGAAPADSALLEQADRICRGELHIFGEDVHLGLAPDWHADWRTGHRWALSESVSVLGGPPGTDIKRPWEAARFHHGLRLAQAYRLTGEARYAQAFAQQILHWLQHNPCGRGIHWAMPMEVALRLINWVSAAAWLGDAPADPAFRRQLLASLHQHGRHVFAHREWNPVARGNHYLACVAGIFYAGILFRDTAEGRRWLAFGQRALSSEMAAQVDENGVAHEGSSGYHLFVTELFLAGALALARLHGSEGGENGTQRSLRSLLESTWGKPFTGRLEKMFEFVAACAEGRPAPPIWGDCDDGCVLPCCATAAPRAHHLLAVAATLFDREDWAPAHPCSEPLWWTGTAAGSAATPPRSTAPLRAFPRAGFFFFASRRLRGSIRCGPLGVNGWANHAHCDQLAFELCADGAPVLVDAGTYLYSGDPAARNALRSTRAHNTPMVEAAEQNRFWPGLLFRIMDDTRSRLLRCHDGEDGFAFAGEHYGYRRLPQRITVRRDLRLRQAADTLLVVDTLSGEGRARVEWNFTLAPGIAPSELHTAPAQLTGEAPEGLPPHSKWRLGSLGMRIGLADKDGLESRVEPGWFAPHYGQRVPARVLRLAGTFQLPLRIAFCFAPLAENK